MAQLISSVFNPPLGICSVFIKACVVPTVWYFSLLNVTFFYHFQNRFNFRIKSTYTQISNKERFDNSQLRVLLKYCHLTQPSQRGNRTHAHCSRFWREEQPVTEKRPRGLNFRLQKNLKKKIVIRDYYYCYIIIIIIIILIILFGWGGGVLFISMEKSHHNESGFTSFLSDRLKGGAKF